MTDRNTLRISAIIQFVEKFYPNFDYVLEKDLFYKLFREISNTSSMTFYRAAEEMILLGACSYEQKRYTIHKKEFEEIYIKNLVTTDKKTIEVLETILIKKFKGKGVFQ